MTATVLEIVELEDLDFAIMCQAVNTKVWSDGRVETEPMCDRSATHMARIHQAYNCAWTEKFLCADCLSVYGEPCWECGLTPRIDSIVPIG